MYRSVAMRIVTSALETRMSTRMSIRMSMHMSITLMSAHSYTPNPHTPSCRRLRWWPVHLRASCFSIAQPASDVNTCVRACVRACVRMCVRLRVKWRVAGRRLEAVFASQLAALELHRAAPPYRNVFLHVCRHAAQTWVWGSCIERLSHHSLTAG